MCTFMNLRLPLGSEFEISRRTIQLINGQASEGGIRENLGASRHGGQMSNEQ